MSTPPRTLADDLRGRSEVDLRALLEGRPDLLTPVPSSASALAVRAASAPSVHRALDRCDRLTLQVLEVLAALPDPVCVDEVLVQFAEAGTSAAAAAAYRLARCRRLALVWGADDALHLVRTVREAFGAAPCGLGPSMRDARPLVRAYATDPARLDDVLADAPQDARLALDRLVWGPPVGRAPEADRPVSIESARTPLEWLLARDLLVATGPETVALPREIALHLRGGRLLASIDAPPGPLARTAVRASAVHEVLAALETAYTLIDTWGATPTPALRSGGIGVRETAAVAKTLGCTAAEAAWWIEVLHAAGLIGLDEEGAQWLPTLDADAWLELDRAEQWVELAHAWLTTARTPDAARTLTADAADLRAPALRTTVLGLIAEDAGAPDVEALLAEFDYRFARGARPERSDSVRAVLAEAARLGFTAGGAMTAAGAALLRGSFTDSVSALAAELPVEVDEVLLQADLTAVAPGPLTRTARAQLRLLGDVESTGGATVFRFSARSLTRAFEAGYDASAVLAILHARSATPVPQALEYLVADLARQRASVRIGAAQSYAHCDDPAVLAAALVDRRAKGLGIRELAPGVIAAQAAPEVLARFLREAGAVPVVEGTEGAVLTVRPSAGQRVAGQRAAGRLLAGEPVDVALVVRALRGGRAQRAGAEGGRAADAGGADDVPRSPAARVLALLREAVAARATVRIGYADDGGAPQPHIVEPIRVASGRLTAYDHTDDTVRTFTLARITGAVAG